MIYATLLLCLVSLGQSSSVTSPTGIPEGATIFTVTYKTPNGDITVDAAIKTAKDGFLSEYDRSAAPLSIELYLDTPCAPAPPDKVLTQNIKIVEKEPTANRAKRLEDAGCVQADGRWVAADIVARDARARELRKSREDAISAAIAPYAFSATPEPAPSAGPGFVALWGRHIVIAVSALVMIAITVKVCFGPGT